MKKLMKSLMLFAAAAMALTSCENEAMNEGIEANDTYTMTFVAGAPESKTSVEVDGTTANFYWGASETFTFVQNTTAGLDKGTNVNFTNNEGIAEISATFTEVTSPIVAIYPEDAYVSNNDNYNKVKLIVRKDQDILDGTFDPNADLMISKEITPVDANATHLLQFTRLVAVGKMTLKNLPVDGTEIIEKVNFSISSENALTGRLYIDLATAEVSEWGYYNNAEKEVNLKGGAVTAATANDFYFTCMPAIVAEGETFTVTVTTDKSIYTHTVTIPAGKSIEFKSGRVSSFGVNMADAQKEANSALELPWIEGFDDEDLSAYDVVNGDSDTKVYADGNLAFGVATGEILIGKNGGSMTATLASDGTAKTLNLWFKSNNPSYISASSATEGVTVTKLTNTGYTVALAEGVSTFKLTLSNLGTGGNARVDDITLTEEAPAVEKLTIEGATLSFTAGSTFETGNDFTVTAVYQNGTTETVTADVDSSAVNMSDPGTYTVTVTYNDVVATYEVTVQAAGVQTKTIELGTGTFANSTITWTQDGVTVVQAKGNSSSAVSSSYATASTMRLYQGHTLTFSCATNITKIEMVSNGTNYGKTATVNVGTLNNPKTSGCTLTWTGSAKEIVLTNGTGSGGSQLRTSSIKITYEVSNTPVDPGMETLATPTNVEAIAVEKDVLISWDEVANATSYRVTCGTQEATVTDLNNLTAEFTMDAYDTEYNITVVAKAEGYNDSAAAETTVTTEEDPNGGGGDEATETFTLSGTFTLANKELSLTQNGITVKQYIASGSTAVNSSYNTPSTLRVYKGHALSFTGKTITKIEITYKTNYYGNSITVNTGTFEAATNSGGTHVWTGESDNVVITNTGTASNVQLRIDSINITYKN